MTTELQSAMNFRIALGEDADLKVLKERARKAMALALSQQCAHFSVDVSTVSAYAKGALTSYLTSQGWEVTTRVMHSLSLYVELPYLNPPPPYAPPPEVFPTEVSGSLTVHGLILALQTLPQGSLVVTAEGKGGVSRCIEDLSAGAFFAETPNTGDFREDDEDETADTVPAVCIWTGLGC